MIKNNLAKYGAVALVALAPVLLTANTTTPKEFLEKALVSNPNLSGIKINVLNTKKIKGLRGWKAYNLQVTGNFKTNGKVKHIKEASMYFSNGTYMTSNMTNMLTGEKISIQPKFLNNYYLKENLISGDSNSKHKIAIFSDPLCPFCREKIPKFLGILKRHPKDFAVYYYDFPLTNIHPASGTIVKINEVLRFKAKKNKKLDIVLEMYNLDINPRENNPEAILSKYNKELERSVNMKEVQSKKVKDMLFNDSDIAAKMSVGGTPTVFVDGEIDESRYLTNYKKFLK